VGVVLLSLRDVILWFHFFPEGKYLCLLDYKRSRIRSPVQTKIAIVRVIKSRRLRWAGHVARMLS
jgi:hypothetical protein